MDLPEITEIVPPSSHSIWPAILSGGFVAGSLDAASAFYSFGAKMCYGIAAGLIGTKALPTNGAGAGIWILGIGLHFFIAFSIAAIYCVSSRRLRFLRHHFIVGGVACGVAAFLVMNLFVLPLSSFPFPVGPFTVSALRLGIGFHILLIGMPISTSLWYFSRKAALPAH